MSQGAAFCAGAALMLAFALLAAGAMLPRYRSALLAAAGAAAGALATMLLLAPRKREEAPETRAAAREEVERVELPKDPGEPLSDEMRRSRSRVESWGEEELRERLDDYDARARAEPGADERKRD